MASKKAGTRRMAPAPAPAVLVVVAALALAACAGAAAADKEECFCPCMRDQCMVLRVATREDCAESCNGVCREDGRPGQPNPNEFCGY